LNIEQFYDWPPAAEIEMDCPPPAESEPSPADPGRDHTIPAKCTFPQISNCGRVAQKSPGYTGSNQSTAGLRPVIDYAVRKCRDYGFYD